MIISGFSFTFIVGCLGGVMGEALNWYLRRESRYIAKYLKGLRYWISTIVMIIIGGILAVLYGVEPKSAILVAQIGLSTPLIIKTLAQIPSPAVTKDFSKDPTIRDFLAGR